MSKKQRLNWTALKVEFLTFEGTRQSFFKGKGVGKSTWTRHAGPEWDRERTAHRERIAERAKEKLVERGAETTAEVLSRQAELGRAAASLGWGGLFEEKKGKGGKVVKVLREDLHASDMVRLLQLGLTTEARAKLALEKLVPVIPPGSPTADNPDAKKDSQPEEKTEQSLVETELEEMRKALKDPDKSKAAFDFVKALGFKRD